MAATRYNFATTTLQTPNSSAKRANFTQGRAMCRGYPLPQVSHLRKQPCVPVTSAFDSKSLREADLCLKSLARVSSPSRATRRTNTRRTPVVCKADAAAAASTPAPADSGKISETAAIMNVIKSIMGAGAFALPWAYAQTGLVFTSVYMVVAAALCVYISTLMQMAKKAVLDKDSSKLATFGSYTGYVESTIGPFAGKASQLILLSCCFGICSAYQVFVASTMHTMVPSIVQNDFIKFGAPVFVVLSWLRSLSGVSVISMFGNISLLIGLTIVTGSALQLPAQWGAIPAINVAAFPEAFGSVAFLFFVHFTMPPVESNMQQPELFPRACFKAFAACTVVSAVFGTIGAAYFGPGVSSVIVAMLKGSGIVAAVKVLLCLNILSTFPLIVRGAFDIIEGLLGGAENMSDLQIYAQRTVFVVSAATLAICIPSFGKLLGLVGGVSCTVLTMCFPPLMFYFAYKANGKDIPFMHLLASIIIFVGGVGMAVSAAIA